MTRARLPVLLLSVIALPLPVRGFGGGAPTTERPAAPELAGAGEGSAGGVEQGGDRQISARARGTSRERAPVRGSRIACGGARWRLGGAATRAATRAAGNVAVEVLDRPGRAVVGVPSSLAFERATGPGRRRPGRSAGDDRRTGTGELSRGERQQASGTRRLCAWVAPNSAERGPLELVLVRPIEQGSVHRLDWPDSAKLVLRVRFADGTTFPESPQPLPDFRCAISGKGLAGTGRRQFAFQATTHEIHGLPLHEQISLQICAQSTDAQLN